MRWKNEGLHDKLPRWNLDNSVVVHPQLSHNGFLLDSALWVLGIFSFVLGFIVIFQQGKTSYQRAF
jgi:hypothetical protein